MKNRILVMVLTMVMVLVMISGCSSEVEEINEDVQLQASENFASTGEVKPSEGKAEASDKEEPTSEEAPKGSSEDLTEVSKASEGSSSAPTEPATETTAPATQPTHPTQQKIPVVTEPPHQHSYSATVIAPTCNDKGYTKYTCSCGYSYNDNYTAALGHHYIDEVIAPTTSVQGYTKHTCDRCWYSYNDTYTDPVKQVFDINAAMEAGNAYALSIGFACIDYSLTPANAGYYPNQTAPGEVITLLGGQSWLEQEMRDMAQATKDNLVGGWSADEHTKCACRTYIAYDAATDTYTWYFLYI